MILAAPPRVLRNPVSLHWPAVPALRKHPSLTSLHHQGALCRILGAVSQHLPFPVTSTALTLCSQTIHPAIILFLLVLNIAKKKNQSRGQRGAFKSVSGLINRRIAGRAFSIVPCFAPGWKCILHSPRYRGDLKSYNLLILLHKAALSATSGSPLRWHHPSLWRGPKQRVLTHVRVDPTSGPRRAVE